MILRLQVRSPLVAVLLVGLVMAAMGGMPAVSVHAADHGFRDTSASVFASDIEWLADEGITKGCNPPDNDRFCPNSSVTRGQMAAFLVRALDLDHTSGKRFDDVPADHTFAREIDILATAGITRGTNQANDRFEPHRAVTRGQMAAFLVRALAPEEASQPGSSDEGYTYQGRTSGTVTIPAGYPNPSTVGLAGRSISESSLQTYTGPTSFSSGTHVIEGRRITSQITVSGSAHVTIRDSLVEHGDRYGLHTSFSDPGRLTVEDSNIRMTDASSRALVGHNITVHRSDLRQGTTVSNLQHNTLVEDSFVADPGWPSHSGGHHDGIQTVGADAFTVRGSTILGPWRGQTSAFILQADVRPLRDVTLEDNFISGGGYSLYIRNKPGQPAPSNVTVRNNLWNDGSWQFGPVSLDCGADWTWNGNRTTNGTTVTGC